MQIAPSPFLRRAFTLSAAVFISLIPSLAATQNQVDFVGQLYADLLNRPIEHTAVLRFEGMFNAGGARSQVSASVTGSAEYRGILVTGYYQNLLNRPPSGPELQAGIQFLDGMSEEQFQAFGIGSAEFLRQAGDTSVGWVQSAFRSILNRPPTVTEQQNALRLLSVGTERTSIALTILDGDEHRRQVVNRIYQLLLRRPPSPQELESMQLAILYEAGDRFVTDVLAGSDEYLRFASQASAHLVIPCV